MKKIMTLITALMLCSFQLNAKLQLVNLADLRAGMEHHQQGLIPVFKSQWQDNSQQSIPQVVNQRIYNIYHRNNIIAVVDGQLVVFPKRDLSISNGLSPFKDLMGISNGLGKLKPGLGIGVWDNPDASSSLISFLGFAPLESIHLLKGTAVTVSNSQINRNLNSTTISSFDSTASTTDDDIKREIWVIDILSRHNPWDFIWVRVDGMMVKMSAGALVSHVDNGAFTPDRLGPLDVENP